MENSNYTSRNWMFLERGVVGLGIVAAMTMTKTKTKINVVSSAKPAANFRGIFYASSLTIGTQSLFPSPHFLSTCNLCDKHLHGVDIFIYSWAINLLVAVGLRVIQSKAKGDIVLHMVPLVSLHSMWFCSDNGILPIYIGEKAYCSAQCRETHIRNDDDLQHKCRSRSSSSVMKPLVVHNSVRLPILAA
ncbi:hypothetical protein Fmac_030367 [Flemingia macrophylla]|uniref:FLZ-type domain-containing protein n=1 Tax=Flemingia macrophylla TaxID=520843 RepID=A0ABD1LD81_9FABA